MDEQLFRHIQSLYDLNHDIPHRAFQFPRLPPGLIHPMSKTFENPIKAKFVQDSSNLSKKLDGFQNFYQQYASGLTMMNGKELVPPGHPLYSEKNSIKILKKENERLEKQNMELKKKLESKEVKQ